VVIALAAALQLPTMFIFVLAVIPEPWGFVLWAVQAFIGAWLWLFYGAKNGVTRTRKATPNNHRPLKKEKGSTLKGCDSSYESLVCPRTNFVELKVKCHFT
jgi:hypothetical protein